MESRNWEIEMECELERHMRWIVKTDCHLQHSVTFEVQCFLAVYSHFQIMVFYAPWKKSVMLKLLYTTTRKSELGHGRILLLHN